MITTVTFNPAVDKTAEVTQFVVGGLNRLFNIRQDAGGKGINVSKTLKALGTSSLAAGFLGGSAGAFIEQALEKSGIETRFIQVAGNTRTNLKVLNEEMELTELNEPGPEVNPEKIDELISQLLEDADKNDLVILSGNVGPGVNPDVYRNMIERLREKKIRCILDADGALFQNGIKARPYAIKPNRFELAQYFGLNESDLNTDKLIELGRNFLNEDTRLVAISMGIEGSLFITEDEVISSSALKIDYQSAVGAGDAMVAAIADGIEKNMKLADLVKWAVAVSAGACTTQGTQPASLETVLELEKQVRPEVLFSR